MLLTQSTDLNQSDWPLKKTQSSLIQSDNMPSRLWMRSWRKLVKGSEKHTIYVLEAVTNEAALEIRVSVPSNNSLETY